MKFRQKLKRRSNRQDSPTKALGAAFKNFNFLWQMAALVQPRTTLAMQKNYANLCKQVYYIINIETAFQNQKIAEPARS